MENQHGSLSVDMLSILNQKVRRCLQCSRLSLGFQHILYFCGGIGYSVVMVSKSDLFQLANVFFLRFFWIFLLFLVFQSECQLKILLAHLISSSLISKTEISQFTRLLSADSCASIFQMSCSLYVIVAI